MPPTMTKKAPAGLGSRGRAFWREVTAAMVVDGADELQRRVDEDGLAPGGKPHVLLPELRAQHVVLAKLFGGMRWPDPAGKPATMRQIRASEAAKRRWQSHNNMRKEPR